MNILKHMEAIFVVALAAIGTANFVAQAAPKPAAQDSAIATPTRMAVVTVSAKRLSYSERQQLLAERGAGSHA